MRKQQKGFTLIELMIVVAIVGILAAIAIPAYRDFQVRSKVSEILAAMGACKTSVSEFYQSNNGWDTSGGGVNIAAIPGGLCSDAQSQYMQGNMTINATGFITATSTATDRIGPAAAQGQTITMAPDCNADAAGADVCDGAQELEAFICGDLGGGSTTMPAKYRPGSCQG